MTTPYKDFFHKNQYLQYAKVDFINLECSLKFLINFIRTAMLLFHAIWVSYF